MVTASAEKHAEKQKSKESSTVLRNIEATKPLLFNLAEQVLNTEKDHWNVIIGDDAGGRLPARFIHDILKQDGRDIKTFFVASSKIYRDANGSEPYLEYFKYLEEQVGEPLRPLVVTESVGTGSAVDFLRDTLTSFSSQVPEIATVAVSEASEHKVDYAGDVGEAAIDEVWHAYESPPVVSLGKRAVGAVMRRISRSPQAIENVQESVNTTVGIQVGITSPEPIARRSPTRDGQLAHEAYQLMDAFASEAYADIHDKQSITV